MFEFLSDLEKSLATVIKGVGKITHSYWRSYHTEIRREPADAFVDGDLIETFLDLSKSDMEAVVDGLKVITVIIFHNIVSFIQKIYLLCCLKLYNVCVNMYINY